MIVNPRRFQSITGKYPRLRVAVVGDFCLDRYLEIDPARGEISIETGLPVHIADDPLSAVAEGTGRVLQELQFLKRVTSSSK